MRSLPVLGFTRHDHTSRHRKAHAMSEHCVSILVQRLIWRSADESCRHRSDDYLEIWQSSVHTNFQYTAETSLSLVTFLGCPFSRRSLGHPPAHSSGLPQTYATYRPGHEACQRVPTRTQRNTTLPAVKMSASRMCAAACAQSVSQPAACRLDWQFGAPLSRVSLSEPLQGIAQEGIYGCDVKPTK